MSRFVVYLKGKEGFTDFFFLFENITWTSGELERNLGDLMPLKTDCTSLMMICYLSAKQ